MVNGLSISGVSKQFTNPQGEVITALSNVDLDIAPGSFISLIGPSGCGKSTLLRLIAGLIQPDSGTLTLDGAPITKPGSDRGFMFQDHTLFPWLTIYDNIAFGLRAQGVFQEKEASVKEFIDLVGLAGFEKYYPHQLSGGMCQRASLARALVGHPKVLLLDEPLGALDAFTRMNIQDEILRIWKEHSMTMIMVTHDVDEAVYLSEPGRRDDAPARTHHGDRPGGAGPATGPQQPRLLTLPGGDPSSAPLRRHHSGAGLLPLNERQVSHHVSFPTASAIGPSACAGCPAADAGRLRRPERRTQRLLYGSSGVPEHHSLIPFHSTASKKRRDSP